MIDVLLPAGIGWVDAIGRSLRDGFFMFREILWPLILGAGLSGAVHAFISSESVQAKMRNHRPGSDADDVGELLGVKLAAGLTTEGISLLAGLVPSIRPTQIAPARFSWNYTT
jgi:hypothetical protein